MARAFATLLIPEDRNTNTPFFADGSRELVYAAIMGLNKTAGTNWTFRDLLCALDSIEHIQAVSKAEPRAYRLVSRIMEDEKDLRGILSTLGTRMGRFEQVAALWNSNPNPRKFSIQDFLSKPGILVLGYDPVLNDSIWPINALLLKALTNEILRRPNTLTPKTWFVLDEFRAMQKVDCIHDLLNRGRSKGASVMLGIQSVEGMEEVYGEKGANDLLGQCANKTFLRAGGPHTAQWAERYFGHTRQMESIRSESWSQGYQSQSVQYSVQERSLFLSSFFMDLPSPKPGRWMISVNDVPAEDAVYITRRWFEQLLSWTLPASAAPALIPRDEISEQILQSWDEHEEKYFCGSEATENTEDVQLPEAGSWQNREDSNRDA